MKIIEEMLLRFELGIDNKIKKLKNSQSPDEHTNKIKFRLGKLKGLSEIKSEFLNFRKRLEKLYNYPDSPNYLLMESKDAAGLYYSKQRKKELLEGIKEEPELDRDI